MDLDAYRRSAETFLSELEAEYYRHYAGLKEAYEIEPIYARHGELFTRQAIESLRELGTAATPESEERRRLTMLLGFAAEGYLGEATKTLEAELARREAGLSFELDGRRLGFRESSVVQANEPDPEAREAIEHARLHLTERELGSLYRDLIERQHESATALGWGSYSEMCAECKSIDLAGLQQETLAFIAATSSSFREVVDPALRHTLGFGLDRMRRSDIPRFFRAPGRGVSRVDPDGGGATTTRRFCTREGTPSTPPTSTLSFHSSFATWATTGSPRPTRSCSSTWPRIRSGSSAASASATSRS